MISWYIGRVDSWTSTAHISWVSRIADKETSKCDRRLFVFRRNYPRILGNVNYSRWQWHVIFAYCIYRWWLLFGHYSPSFITRISPSNDSSAFDLEMICWISWRDALRILLVVDLLCCLKEPFFINLTTNLIKDTF